MSVHSRLSPLFARIPHINEKVLRILIHPRIPTTISAIRPQAAPDHLKQTITHHNFNQLPGGTRLTTMHKYFHHVPTKSNASFGLLDMTGSLMKCLVFALLHRNHTGKALCPPGRSNLKLFDCKVRATDLKALSYPPECIGQVMLSRTIGK